MGWSCRADAAKTLDKVTAHCVKTTGTSNTWKGKDGLRYFYEGVQDVEHRDGAITGEIFQMVGDDSARQVATFRIEGNGSLSKAPQVWRDAVAL